jgi:hypothetical protein
MLSLAQIATSISYPPRSGIGVPRAAAAMRMLGRALVRSRLTNQVRKRA